MRQLIGLFRLSNVTWLVLIAAAAYGLYFVKYQVLELQRQTAALEKDLQMEVEHLHVIEAEWAYLTRPDRLQALVQKHTTLKPVAGMQVQQLAVLPFPPQDGPRGDGVLVAGLRGEQ